MERVLAWPFERVVVSHGAIVSFDAHNVLREAFAWL
jgi:hypothetical protein